MASPFAKYQSEQVQQMAPGFVEAYGRAGASIGQGSRLSSHHTSSVTLVSRVLTPSLPMAI
jgi:hypothetical protein